MPGDFDIKNSVARDTILSHLVMRAFSAEMMEKHRRADLGINNLAFLRKGWERFDRAVGELRNAGFGMDTIFAGAQVEEFATAEPYGKRRPVLEWNEKQIFYTESLEDFAAGLIAFKKQKEAEAPRPNGIDYKEYLSKHADAVLSVSAYVDGTPQPNFEAAILLWEKPDCPVHTHGRDAAASYYVIDRHPEDKRTIEYKGQLYPAGSLVQQIWTVVCGVEDKECEDKRQAAIAQYGPDNVQVAEGLHGEKVLVVARPEDEKVVPPGGTALLEQGRYHKLRSLPAKSGEPPNIACTMNAYGVPARHREIKMEGPCSACFFLQKSAKCQALRQAALDGVSLGE